MRPYSMLMGAVLTIGLSAWAASGCQVIGGFEDFSSAAGGASGSAGTSGAGGTAGAAGTAGTSGTAGSGGTNTTPCNPAEAPGAANKGPEMKGVRLNSGTCVWIDSTEVTNDQYKVFIESSPNLALQDDFCSSWNDAFEADPACLASPNDIVINTAPGAPIVCVDQCDARAFCEWSGKKLCNTGYLETTKPEDDPWLAACAGADGLRDYPYGSTSKKEVCNGNDQTGVTCSSGNCTTVPSGSLTSCTGPEGIFDLVGNVAEWSEACSGILGTVDDCLIRGGSVTRSAADNTCKADIPSKRNTHSHHIGFRCCGP